jgi:hypothetical protein
MSHDVPYWNNYNKTVRISRWHLSTPYTSSDPGFSIYFWNTEILKLGILIYVLANSPYLWCLFAGNKMAFSIILQKAFVCWQPMLLSLIYQKKVILHICVLCLLLLICESCYDQWMFTDKLREFEFILL